MIIIPYFSTNLPWDIINLFVAVELDICYIQQSNDTQWGEAELDINYEVKYIRYLTKQQQINMLSYERIKTKHATQR